jgi:leader peptidase (prepilin peptidase)/N-methyltransferase
MPESILFAAPGSYLSAAIAGIFGLLIGSFLNVVIHRMPKIMQRGLDDFLALESEPDNRNESIKQGSSIQRIQYESSKPLPHTDQYNLVVPRSACPHCGHQITAIENIPVFSYLFLRGKCIACKAHISLRYPIIELLTCLLSGYLVWHFGSGWAGMSTLVFAYLLIALTFIDADTKLLPDDLTYPLLWCGLLINLNGTFVPIQDAIIGAVIGYLVLWSVYWAFKLITGKEGMGYGDFKLLAALGAWLGWQMLPIIVLLSSLVGALVGIALIVLRKMGRDHPIPFGPYLTAAGMIAILHGNSITQAYIGFLH